VLMSPILILASERGGRVGNMRSAKVYFIIFLLIGRTDEDLHYPIHECSVRVAGE
jgi:hypothetical protein